MFSDDVISVISVIADDLGVEPAALLAVVEVESAGVVTALVRGRQEPLIRFEGHYFYRLLKGDQRVKAIAQGLASPKSGAVKNPASQEDRYRLLDRAKMIDAEAAIESCSWGLGQVMGSHWKTFGFSSAQEFEQLARSGVSGQVVLMAMFIKFFRLSDELQQRDWAAFAKAYNGKNYKINKYDTKMAAAYARWKARKLPVPSRASTTGPLPPPPTPVSPVTAVPVPMNRPVIDPPAPLSRPSFWQRFVAALTRKA